MSRVAWNSSTFTDPPNKHQQPRQASPLHTTRSKKKTALVQKKSRFARLKVRGQRQMLQNKHQEKIANSSQLKAKQLQQQKQRERRSLLAREKDLNEQARQRRIRAKDDELRETLLRRKAQAEISKQGDEVGNHENQTDATVDTGLGTMRNNTGRKHRTNGTLPPVPPVPPVPPAPPVTCLASLTRARLALLTKLKFTERPLRIAPMISLSSLTTGVRGRKNCFIAWSMLAWQEGQ